MDALHLLIQMNVLLSKQKRVHDFYFLYDHRGTAYSNDLKDKRRNRLFLGGAGFRWAWAAQVSEAEISNILRFCLTTFRSFSLKKAKIMSLLY